MNDFDDPDNALSGHCTTCGGVTHGQSECSECYNRADASEEDSRDTEGE